ncbi:MAG TPA: chemotaxis protein CheA [Tepidisphaeraceae bacterium]|nr:chemotaxis protein CheA [Tepidisphaeraceae bacterium]
MPSNQQDAGELTALVERIASAVVMADAEDVVALAALHGDLQSAVASGKSSAVVDRATTAEKIVESLILREAQDTAAALKQLSDTVTDMVRAISSIDSSPSQRPTPDAAVASIPATAATPTAAAVQHTDYAADERPIAADDLPLVQEFVAEALGHLEAAEAELLKLEAHADDVECLNAIFRAFHTIKGVSGFLNLRQIGALAHSAENLLDLARKGEVRLEHGSIDLVLESVDVAKALVLATDAAAKAGVATPPNDRLLSLIDRLKACVDAKGATAPVAAAAVPVAAVATDAKPSSTIASAPVAAAPQTETPRPAAPQPRAEAPAANAAPAGNNSNATAGDGTVKVATDRLDSLINMVGELVIAQSMVAQDAKSILGATAGQRMTRNIGHLGKLTRELQDLSMSMRMVPIHGVFQKMARLVRDLTRKSGKEIELNVIGGETELDRNVVEAISDPLIHMVRNAADHGVEMPDVRFAAGKPRVGRIELRAYQQAGKIFVEIADNGRGLNKQRILKKAIAAGIVAEGDELTDQQIFQLIFHAGLSTAEQITDVSGRGVGMDVVKRNVESLRGRIDITSVEGKGATFTIQLPLTLAVIDGLIVRVGSEQYIVPITSIEKSLRPTPEQLSSIQGRGEMCMVRDRLLPLFRLYSMFNVNGAKEDPTDALVVVVQDNDRCCCLLVDELLGQQQVVIKSLGEGVGTVPGISGGAILGDGSVSMILDVPGLIDLAAAA